MKEAIAMEFEKVRDIIAEQMNVPKGEITVETTFKDDLNADSLDIFQIISELEEVFGMQFSTEDAEKIKTVGDAADYIKKALA
jgi:acyl carrier protein